MSGYLQVGIPTDCFTPSSIVVLIAKVLAWPLLLSSPESFRGSAVDYLFAIGSVLCGWLIIALVIVMLTDSLFSTVWTYVERGRVRSYSAIYRRARVLMYLWVALARFSFLSKRLSGIHSSVSREKFEEFPTFIATPRRKLRVTDYSWSLLHFIIAMTRHILLRTLFSPRILLPSISAMWMLSGRAGAERIDPFIGRITAWISSLTFSSLITSIGALVLVALFTTLRFQAKLAWKRGKWEKAYESLAEDRHLVRQARPYARLLMEYEHRNIGFILAEIIQTGSGGHLSFTDSQVAIKNPPDSSTGYYREPRPSFMGEDVVQALQDTLSTLSSRDRDASSPIYWERIALTPYPALLLLSDLDRSGIYSDDLPTLNRDSLLDSLRTDLAITMENSHEQGADTQASARDGAQRFADKVIEKHYNKMAELAWLMVSLEHIDRSLSSLLESRGPRRLLEHVRSLKTQA